MPADPEATLFLGGDLMTGRGIDQVLPHTCEPDLYEPWVTSALEYVRIAERANGPIPRPVDYAYVWGDGLEALEQARPDARIVNLETSFTTCGDVAPKAINYRMHPLNVPVLRVAAIDCCVLGNNHVMDWGEAGLLETLEALEDAGLAVAGAGRDLEAARAPAALELPGGGRVLVLGLGGTDSGIPPRWAAGITRPGVDLLTDYSDESVTDVADRIARVKRAGDVVVASIHWGGNWGYEIPDAHRGFAHALIDRAGVDVVHGHSSHHAKAIEVYRGRPILYGCGDLLNDYEGIRGHEEYRGDVAIMYFVTVDRRTGLMARLRMRPLRIRRFRLNRPPDEDLSWMRDTLDRECGAFGHRVRRVGEALELEWG